MARAAGSGVEWQSSLDHDLKRKVKATIRANWSEITAHLAPPGVAWRWGESGLSERLKHYLSYHNLIEEDPDDADCWQTTEELWMFVIDTASDDETIGAEATGQQHITEPGVNDPDTRVLTPKSPLRTRGENHQTTLDGDEIVNDDGEDGLQKIEANRSKGESNPTRAERMAEDPAQCTLTAVFHGWVGPTVREESALSTPNGECYTC